MPELPDVTVYVEALRRRLLAPTPAVLDRVSIRSPFLLRTVEPPVDAAEGRRVVRVSRLGKRVVIGLDGGVSLVLHLMIAGRLLWKGAGARPGGRIDLSAFAFVPDGPADPPPGGARDSPSGALPGTLVLTEASQQKRASLHVVAGEAGLRALDPGGVDVLTCPPERFAAALRAEHRTLKRALTDPRTIDGVGNAYSDEILHAAGMSPFLRTRDLDEAQCARLHAAAKATLERWSAALLAECGLDKPGTGRFPGPGQITAFRPGFAVHGRFGEPCPACGAPVQRVVWTEREMNYCPGCQTGGRILADRSLSRLLRDEWPRTLEDLEG